MTLKPLDEVFGDREDLRVDRIVVFDRDGGEGFGAHFGGT
jgi:hypothetical protein